MASTEPGNGRIALEPAHWLVSAFDTAMILFDPVVEILISSMAHTLAEFGPDRPRVTVVPVGRHSGRGDTGDCLGGTEERLGGRHVARLAQPDVHQRTRSVDSAIEIAPAALDLDVGASGAGQLPPSGCLQDTDRHEGSGKDMQSAVIGGNTLVTV